MENPDCSCRLTGSGRLQHDEPALEQMQRAFAGASAAAAAAAAEPAAAAAAAEPAAAAAEQLTVGEEARIETLRMQGGGEDLAHQLAAFEKQQADDRGKTAAKGTVLEPESLPFVEVLPSLMRPRSAMSPPVSCSALSIPAD